MSSRLIKVGREPYNEMDQLISKKGELISNEAGLVVKFATRDKRKPGYLVLIPNDEIEKYIEAHKKTGKG